MECCAWHQMLAISTRHWTSPGRLPCWLADQWHNQWLSEVEAHSKDCCAGPNPRYNVCRWYKIPGGGFESWKLSFVPLADFESNCGADRSSSHRSSRDSCSNQAAGTILLYG